MKLRTNTILVLLCLLVLSCKEKKRNFELTSFNPVLNKEFVGNDSLVKLSADLTNAPLYGITIPTKSQCSGGNLLFSFQLKRTTQSYEKLFYKIYYQNESYKFPDDHEYSAENFYGSWEDVTMMGFKEVPEFKDVINVIDSFRIVGNPRDEKTYYGPHPDKNRVRDSLIARQINAIKSSVDWTKQVEDKAVKEKRSFDEQLRLDAAWAAETDLQQNKGNFNNRSERNPRAGKYEFMIVVASESAWKAIPYYMKNIGLPNIKSEFINPFSYFLHKEGKKMTDVVAQVSKKKLKVNMKFNLGSGVYVNKQAVNPEYNKEYYSTLCGESNDVFKKAHFQQYFHYINKDFPLKNIPEIRDVIGENYSRAEYNLVKDKYENSGKFINTYVNSSTYPCKTVVSDSLNNSITLINPGNNPGEFKKEHVGVAGRIGFTYGKWRAKIKFPKIINKQNVWNGLTAAFWLLAQETNVAWNMRRECKAEIAYIPKWEGDNEAALWKSHKRLGYSEIDFEILKESQYWPVTSYKKLKYQEETPALLDDITVTCTNWDMACHEPKKFDIGAIANEIDGMTYVHHRWNPWYKALTTKIPVKHKEIFEADYYYFEIDWQPTRITWRIGPEKDKMRVICVMDNTVSAIPNNQMVAIVTQEWHSQEWWPNAPFKQNFVPFPKKDIVGKILEIEIE